MAHVKRVIAKTKIHQPKTVKNHELHKTPHRFL